MIAYGDEAGTHGDSIFTVMAGWIGHEDRWAEFNQKWKSLLLRNGLTHIHAVDLKHGKKQFKDRRIWPEPRRLALAQEASSLAVEHALFSHSILLRNSDFDTYYLGGDHGLRRHRGPLDSKYGICARNFLSQLAEFVMRYCGADAQVTAVLEAGAKNQGAAQTILDDSIESHLIGRGSLHRTLFMRKRNRRLAFKQQTCLHIPFMSWSAMVVPRS
jgi:hypothetical protein